MTNPTREVHLPEDLCQAAENRFGVRFCSVDELLTFVLRELTSDDALRLDEREQQIIEERLRGLGYI
jgi:hypothetical protein